jgi:hypothetical protein
MSKLQIIGDVKEIESTNTWREEATIYETLKCPKCKGISVRSTEWDDGMASADELSWSVRVPQKDHFHALNHFARYQTDQEFMRLAVEEASKSVSEPNRVSPKVGAVLARDGKLIDKAFRGELAPGDHAEFTLLERKCGSQRDPLPGLS